MPKNPNLSVEASSVATSIKENVPPQEPSKIEITNMFAEYVSDYEVTLDEITLTALRTALLDYVSIVSIAGKEETITLIKEYLADELNANMNSVTTRGLLYGMLSHIQDFDDIHDYMSLHLEAPVFSSAFASAEHVGADGRTFAIGLIKGVQVMTALSEGLMPEHYTKGWIATATLGVFGAVATAGSIFGLDKTQMCHAFGLAASCSSGLQLSLGSMAKSYQVANAVRNGIECALLAKRGFTGNSQIFDTAYLEMISDKVSPIDMKEKLFGPCTLQELRYKQFPCGVPTHPGILNCSKIMRENDLKPCDIEKIELWTYPRGRKLTGNLCPKTPLQGKFSIAYGASAGTVFGFVDSNTFTWEVFNTPELQETIKKIEINADPTLNDTRGGRAVVTTKDGRLFKEETHLFGKAVKLEDQVAQVDSKFDSLMKDNPNANAIRSNINRIEVLANIKELTRLFFSL